MKETVFEKILSGKQHAFKIHENKGALAFLDKDPVAPGHVLVIPKSRARTLADISQESLAAVMGCVKQVAGLLEDRLCATGVNVLHASGADAQQSVPYFHVHVIARFPDDKKDFWPFETENDVSLHEVARKLS